MTEIEDIEKRLNLLENKYNHHIHDGYNGMSFPLYEYYCPKCESLNPPAKQDGAWYCPDCGRNYERNDYRMAVYGNPYLMPRKKSTQCKPLYEDSIDQGQNDKGIGTKIIEFLLGG